MYGHLQIIKSVIYDLMIVKSYGHGDDFLMTHLYDSFNLQIIPFRQFLMVKSHRGRYRDLFEFDGQALHFFNA